MSDTEEAPELVETPDEELAVDPNIEQPTQDPHVVIQSDPDAE